MIKFSNPYISMITMPGGEQHIKLESTSSFYGIEYAFCSFEGSNDLLQLSIWADAVNRDGGSCFIGMPYLPGARQDRRSKGEALSAKVYAGIINSWEALEIKCIDPHSHVMPALIDNLVVIDPTDIIVQRAQFIPGAFTGVIIPDAGAGKRAIAVAEKLGVPYYQALKHRDPKTGRLSNFTCQSFPNTGRYLIVDDICDGGGTFIGLAETLGLPREQLSLWVTHGIFSGDDNQRAALEERFNVILTTNSHVFKNKPRNVTVVHDLYSLMNPVEDDE